VAGDDADLLALYDAEMDRLVSFLRGSDRTIRFQDAEELACDALMVAREHWTRLRGQGDPVAFVFTVAQRRLTTFRRARPRDGDDVVSGHRAPHSSAQDVARAARLEAALERLSYRQRQIVLLRELLGFSVAQTATILDLTDEKVLREVGEDAAGSAVRPTGRRVAWTSAAARAEEFAALGRALRRGPRRRALARRRFVAVLQQIEARPEAIEYPTSLVDRTGSSGQDDSERVVDLRTAIRLPRRVAGHSLHQQIVPARVDPAAAAVIRSSAASGCERDPAFLRRVLAGLRRL
jgi:RNA polymerase sigma factor (sigma-70 family)